MKFELVKQLRSNSQNALSGPKSPRGSQETSLKAIALSGESSLIFVTILKYVPIFLKNGEGHFTLEPAHQLL